MAWKKAMTGLLLAGLMASPAAAFAEAIPLRGIVEGFYGTPWTTTDRMDILGFCGEHGLNAYIYAPKDDPYHRDKWREPYPKKKMKELASLVEKARENRVKFIFAVSPGLDFHYTILRGQHDKKVLLEKLESVYAIGVRDFAIFFDDIDLKESDGKGHAELLNWLDEHFVKRHDGVSPLITVPTEYYRENMVDKGGRVKPYTEEFSQNIRKDVLVLYTGDGVVCPGISEEQLAQADNVYGRHLGIWWNYPVTDYMEQKLALGPVERLPRSSEIPAIFFNPMKYEELSKIALATGADYANDPDHYEPQASWERAIKAQYGKLSEDMMCFAGQSQHLENSWANVGRPDGGKLRAAMDALWKSWPEGASADKDWDDVQKQISELQQASQRLLQELPENQLSECRPQLQQMERIAEADQIALHLMKSIRDGDGKEAKKQLSALKKRHRAILKAEKKALISDKAAKAFLDEVIKYADSVYENGKK